MIARKKRLSKRVTAKFRIINECIKKGMNDTQIIEFLAKQFHQVERCQYVTLKQYYSNPDIVNECLSVISSGEPFFYNDTESCYFCNSSKQIIQHHLSYNPQKLIKICSSCHNKLHFLIKEYHTNIKEKDETIYKLNQRLDIINNAFTTVNNIVKYNPFLENNEKSYENN